LENTNQASIAIGCPTMANTEVNYPTQSILVKILGGYFGSRLMKTLREDKGLTYGVHAYTYHLLGGSYLQIAADVELKSVDYSIELIFEEVENLRKHGVSQDELSLVKNYMIGEYVNDSNTVFDFATLYNKIIMQNLPPTYYEYYYGQIAALKEDTILDFANELLTPADFYTIKVI
jgi:predicted Zn-dependent peptidase